MGFAGIISSAVNWILNLGAATMLPIIIIIFGLILGQGFKKSFKSGITIGIGFTGLNLVIGLMSDSVGKAAQQMIANLGINLKIIDVGWPVGAAITWATPIAVILVPIIFLFNMLLLYLKQTKTMDVDIWNYWHFIFCGALIYYASNKNLAFCIIGTIITAYIIFKLADWTQPVVEHYFGLPGVSLPHCETVNFAPLMYALNKIEDKIPGFNKIDIDEKKINEKFGVFGEPMTVGLIIGVVMGILARYSVAKTLTMGIQLAAVMVLMPRMVSLLMEGLLPISEGARDFISRKFPDRDDIYIGLDAAIVIGNPSNMAVALIMVPITIFLSIILPYNQMLPLVDLAVLPFTVIWAVAASKGNIFRGIINSIITMLGVFFIATDLGALTTTIAKSVNFAFPEGATMISGIDMSCHVFLYFGVKLLTSSTFLFGVIGILVYFAIWYWVRNDIRKIYHLDKNYKPLPDSGDVKNEK